MAEKTTIDSVGPVAAQLKNELSSLEKTQIAGIRNLGSISTRPGVLNGSVSNSITNLNSHQKSAMELGANIAAKLERAGTFSKGAEKVLTSAVSSTVADKIPLAQKFPSNPVDMGRLGNRVPEFNKKSPYEKILDKKNRLTGEGDLNYGGLTFPPDLKQNAASYIELWFWTYERESPTTEGNLSPDLKVWLPIPENFTINQGPNQSVSIIWEKGVKVFSKTYKYSLKPKVIGEEQLIGNATIEVSGTQLQTEPMHISVTKKRSLHRANKKAKSAIKNKVFIVTEVSKNSLNELDSLTVMHRIYFPENFVILYYFNIK